MDEEIIKVDYDNIDVEDIMRQIRENIRSRGYSDKEIQTLNKPLDSITEDNEEFSMSDFQQYVSLNNVRWNTVKAGAITSGRRYIGFIIVFLKRLVRKLSYWYVQFLFDQQNEFNSSVTNSINSIERYIRCSGNRFKDTIERIEKNKGELDKTNQALLNINLRLDDAEQLIKANSIKEYEEKIEQLSNKLTNIEQSLCNKNGEAEQVQRALEIVSNRLRRIEHHIRYNEEDKIEINDSLVKSNIDMDYFLFESKYRGSREEIKEKQKVYLDYFISKKNVVDIGCGRGEFVELLMEEGAEITGIDLNKDNVNHCTDKGLPVKYGEALDFLSKCKDSSLGGIFIGQVIEHLSTQELIALIRLAYKKLQPGAYLVAETINPQCLMVYIESFYMDPTHIKPVHPLTIKFLVDSEGFAHSELRYFAPVSDEYKIPKLECGQSCSNIDEFNEAIAKFNNLMYGYRDYAVVARK